MDIIDAFLIKCKEHPETFAVLQTGVNVSFQSLKYLSECISKELGLRAGNKPKVLIAIEPSHYAYAAMIGTLMSGGTFSALDIKGPLQRNTEIVQAFSPDIILYENTIPEALNDEINVKPSIKISNLTVGDSYNVVPSAEKNKAAYVVFTSGSTGKPKGVSIGREAFSYFVEISQNYFKLKEGEKWAQYSNIGHDLAIMDVFMCLCNGGTLVVLSSESDKLMPAKAIRKHNINIWQSVPSVLNLMIRYGKLKENLKSLRIMSFCGEPLLPGQLDTLFTDCPDIVVYNTYGATETTGFNTLNYLTKDNYKQSCEYHTVALGDNVPGWEVALGNNGEGEIVVHSENLSLGYWNDPNMTKLKFHNVDRDGNLLSVYKTGDIGININGKLYCKGRTDRQVKIKGERIELDEIDYRLRETGCKASVSVKYDDAIISFVETDASVDEDNLRDKLSKVLSFHSVPKKIIKVDEIPINQNGKTDYSELNKRAAKIENAG